MPRDPHHVRLMIEQRENDTLSEHACRASMSAGRIRAEEPDPVRTCFQRDRDRILHSKPFRRLKHKTQVFIDPVGDHYRTRLTHSLEVAQIARTVSRALRLNEDLTEALALGHDVGHTPFGHAGEEALDLELAAMRKLGHTEGLPDRFRHYEQSLRILDEIVCLNLTHETRAGIGGHSKGRSDLSAHDGQPTSTLEAAVVRVSDRIAYLAHDLEDAVRSKMIDSVPEDFMTLGANSSQRIGSMVRDAIENSIDQPAIRMSEKTLETMNALKEWLFDHVYTQYPKVYSDIDKAKALVRELFRYYATKGEMPDGYEGVRGALDYVAGMTDRFAMETYARLKLPRGFREDAVGRVP